MTADLDLGGLRGGRVESRRPIATLGPHGTSSEHATAQLAASGGLGVAGDRDVALYPSFEAAAKAVRAGRASALVVANAYSGANAFYMDPLLELVGVFIAPTPLYGLAVRRGEPFPRSARVATHPAPVPLLGQLLPATATIQDLILTESTTAAVDLLVAGRANLALTNATSLADVAEFASDTRPIRMAWSVFAAARPDRYSLLDPLPIPSRTFDRGGLALDRD
jgi:ABC-type amino acid transport substrate-binding protein